MTSLLKQLGIYGWKQEDENLVLSSLLTGDPLLMIGSHGSAKTHIAYKMAQALSKRFIAYDASKALFEDVLGFPNVESLKNGRVEYVPSAVTVWDKQFILIDEINRALPELQAKWLEIIRSRKIMGFSTEVKWVWAAMNPSTDSRYNGTQIMDAALIGRFSIFLYPPEALDMEEDDRIRVVEHINGDDAPSLGEWVESTTSRTVSSAQTGETGQKVAQVLTRAAGHFVRLRAQFETLGTFLSRFSMLVMKETDGKVKLDGRRLGFMYRNLLAFRAVEMARSEALGDELPVFSESAKRVILASIPVGINQDGINKEEFLHKVEICLDLLADYFRDGSDLKRTETIYRLFTCPDLLEKTRILLRENLSELAKSKAWNDLAEGEQDISVLAYVALQVEAHRPGTVPVELLEKLAGRVGSSSLSSASVPLLKNESIEHLDEINRLLDQPTDMEQMIAFHRVRELADRGQVTSEALARVRKSIRADVQEFKKLVQTAPVCTESSATAAA
jgi:MoxR-like ATPase